MFDICYYILFCFVLKFGEFSDEDYFAAFFLLILGFHCI